jgi:hypothetical protein
METRNPNRQGDALAVATIVAAGCVIGWPVLSGGYLTYLDNPAHLAEIHALAAETQNGWSEIAYCGFPIGNLHSPLWYGILSALAGAGIPAGPVYALFALAGFVAPALAVYRVSRRSLGPLAAGLPAYLLLVQRPAVVGVGSAWGGMWTFFVAAALFVLLVGELTRRDPPRGSAIRVAVLTGMMLLTHLYAVVPLAALALVHLTVAAGRGRRVWRHAIGGAAGVLAASAYWLPLALARGAVVIHPQNLDSVKILARLLLPTHVLNLINGRWPAFAPETVLGSLPMIALVLAGAGGIYRLSRRANDAPLYGTVVAAVLLAVLLFVTGEFDSRFLGPGSWRMLYFVRVGLALASVPLVAWLAHEAGKSGRFAPRTAGIAAAVMAVTAGLLIGTPLRAVTVSPAGAEMTEVRQLWDWLRANHTREWGRVYLQDTFDLPHPGVGLSQSHVLALTAARTGVRQLGATYGVAPYRTIDWTPSEFGTLFRRFVRDEQDIDRVLEWAWAANTTHVVVSDPRTRRIVDRSERFERLFRAGRFTVYRLPGVAGEWVSPLAEGVGVTVTSFETSDYRMDISSSGGPFSVFVKSSWHPGWRLTGPPENRLRLTPEPSGLMRIDGYGSGRIPVGLVYRPSRWPVWLSAAVWILIFLVGARGRIKGPRKIT